MERYGLAAAALVSSTQPFACNTTNTGKWWIDSASATHAYKICDGPSNAWLAAFSVDTVNNIILPPAALASATQPFACNTANVGKWWVDTTTTTYVYKTCDGPGNTWLAEFSVDTVNNIVLPLFAPVRTTQPYACDTAHAGQWWIDNTSSVYAYKTCDGPGNTWVTAFSIDPVANIVSPGGRIPLTADTTFYVSTTGTNGGSNQCTLMSNPCADAQYVLNLLRDSYDLRGFRATIQMAPGTYTAAIHLGTKLVGQTFADLVRIQGDTSNQNNVIIQANFLALPSAHGAAIFAAF